MVYHLVDIDDRVPIGNGAGPVREVGPVSYIAGR